MSSDQPSHELTQSPEVYEQATQGQHTHQQLQTPQAVQSYGHAQAHPSYGAPPMPPGPPGYTQTKPVEWMPAPHRISNCPPGLEYLTQIDQILIHQQIELWEVMTGWQTANRYAVKNTLGQQIYFAAETSNSFIRQSACVRNRPFDISILDNAQNEVIHMARPFSCSSWNFGWCPQKMEVQVPPGQIAGYVKQDCTLWNPQFTIQDAEEREILTISGNMLSLCCRISPDINFDVATVDGASVGKVSRQWGGIAREYFTNADNFGIKFPMDLDVRMKAVVMGACFLIDFIFFENQQTRATQRVRY